ncbi:hypothetical protein AYI69_g10246 [Smittium culicis]|uniref:Uncharacterized protein n=1 Tax=Smittium culicis TaxID=133412 RepID=A0A1R1X709_9FUNG|nr:hypothetical protein AYI69_g10246 [Smittium culicis]
MMKGALKGLLEIHREFFSDKLEELNGARVEACQIEIIDKDPIRLKSYSLVKNLQNEVLLKLQEMENQLVIVP